MGLFAKTTGDGPPPVPPGLHHAICYSIVDLGTHLSPVYGKRQHRVLIQWEIPDQRITVERDGKPKDMPRAISKRYTISMHMKSALRQDVESWRGKPFSDEELEHGFDLLKLLGHACTLNVMHATNEGKTWANVKNVVPAMTSATALKPENPLSHFDIDDLATGIPETIPEWIRKVVQESDEYLALIRGRTPEDAGDDGIDPEKAPF